MEFYIVIGSIVAMLAAIPYLRIFFKRLSMKRRLLNVGKAVGYCLYPTHRGWMLGGKMGKTCDFYIETAHTVYAVKLFAAKKRSQYLIFTDDGYYYTRKFLNLIYRYGTGPRFFKDSKPKKLPTYDFRGGYREEWSEKILCPVLLLNPTGIQVHRNRVHQDTILSSGEKLSDMSVYTLPALLNELERNP